MTTKIAARPILPAWPKKDFDRQLLRMRVTDVEGVSRWPLVGRLIGGNAAPASIKLLAALG